MATPVSQQGAPLTKAELVTQLEHAAQRIQLPVTNALLRALAEVLKQGEPAWWPKIAKAWEHRRFTSWNEAWGLLLTAVHYDALKDPENPLVPFFPSCGGTPEADPSRALMRFLAEADSKFYDKLARGHRRNYVALRSALWQPGAIAFFGMRQLPYYMIEVDAGAGLDLASDLVKPHPNLNADLILARIGLDPDPLDLNDIEARRWLTAATFPDSVEAIQELDAAADALVARQNKEAAFVQLANCAAELGPGFVRKNVPVEEDAGVLLMNMGSTVRMSDVEYQAYSSEVTRLLQDWGGRGLWLEVENVRGELFSSTVQVRLHRLVDGVLKTHIAASIDFAAGAERGDDRATTEFLKP